MCLCVCVFVCENVFKYSFLHCVHMHMCMISYLAFCICVFQLIARLKREIQSLKEELVMVTGQQRDDQLTVEEIQKYVTLCSLITYLF